MRSVLALVAVGGVLALGAATALARLGSIPEILILAVCLVLLDAPLVIGCLVTGRQLRRMDDLYGKRQDRTWAP